MLSSPHKTLPERILFLEDTLTTIFKTFKDYGCKVDDKDEYCIDDWIRRELHSTWFKGYLSAENKLKECICQKCRDKYNEELTP